jgi:hypothetical protein
MGRTDFLFARPSFLEGVARVIDLGSTLQVYNTSDTPEQADRRALSEDFAAVGDDMREAIRKMQAGTGT